MRRSLPLLALALTAALALPVAGCGESEEEQFNDEFQSLNDRIVEVGERVGTSISDAGSKSNRELTREFSRYADELGSIGDELEDLDAPGDLSRRRDQLADAVAKQERNLDAIAKAAREGDAGAAGRATRELVRSSPELRDARRALDRAAERAVDGN